MLALTMLRCRIVDIAPWAGTVQLTPGRLIFVGSLGPAHTHSHAAVQLLVVCSGVVLLSDGRGAELSVRAAVVPAGASHAMIAEDAFGSCVYLDAAGRQGRALGEGVDRFHVRRWALAAEPALRSGALDMAAVTNLVDSMAGHDRPPQHPCLRRAVTMVGERIDGPVRLREVAAALGISPSRLRHLFSDELGLPFTAYVRWMRLKVAMEAVRDGGNLTQAAHRAGFADSAHLTRVTHAMFGLAPSRLVRGIRWV